MADPTSRIEPMSSRHDHGSAMLPDRSKARPRPRQKQLAEPEAIPAIDQDLQDDQDKHELDTMA